MNSKKRNITNKKPNSNSFISLFIITLFLSSIMILTNCESNNNSTTPDNSINSNKVLVISTGYGDSKESALKDARNESIFKAYGAINTDDDGNLIIKSNGECINFTILTESKDEIGMWTVKIEAEVIEKIWQIK